MSELVDCVVIGAAGRHCPGAPIDIEMDGHGYGAGPIVTTQHVLVRLPRDLAERFRQHVAARQRSAFVQRLLEQALPIDDGDQDRLYRLALEVEDDARLSAEMADWDATIADGPASPPAASRLG